MVKKPPRKDNPYVRTRLEDIYYAMVYRCHNPKSSTYYKYGAKGITVCEEWKRDKFTFFEWALSHGYSDSLSIDRIDNSKGYCPENCRWLDVKGQANNRTTNHRIEANGKNYTIAEWSAITGIGQGTILRRITRGWTPARAVTEPINTNYHHK